MVWRLGQQKQKPHEGQGRNPRGAGALPKGPFFLLGPPQTSAMWAAAGLRDDHAWVTQQPSWAPGTVPQACRAGPFPHTRGQHPSALGAGMASRRSSQHLRSTRYTN